MTVNLKKISEIIPEERVDIDAMPVRFDDTPVRLPNFT